MELIILLSIAAYVASIIISYFKGILKKEAKTYIIIVVVYVLLLSVKTFIINNYSIDTVGIAIAGLVTFMDKGWILYISPVYALISALIKGKDEE